MASSSDGPLLARGSESSASSDEIQVTAPRPKVRPSKKRSMAELVENDGPLTLALLIGQPRGRWWPELNGPAKQCKDARDRVAKVAGNALSGQGADVLVGVVVVRGWRFVRGSASHLDTYALMAASEAFHRRREGQRFLEHEIVASASVRGGDGSPIEVSADITAGSPGFAGRRLLQQVLGSSASAEVTSGEGTRALGGGGRRVAVSEVLASWKTHYAVDEAKCVAWPVLGALALAMAEGAWYGDVSVRHRRQIPGENTIAPTGPSVGLLRHFVGQEVERVRPPDNVVVVSGQVWGGKRGAARGYHPQHILASLRAGQHVNNKAKVKQQMLNTLRFFHPTSWMAKFRKDKVDSVPHATTLRRSVINLDFAAMLAQRKWYSANGPTYRYLAFDASPQRGHEFFVTVERVVQRKALRSAVEGTLPEVQERLLPLCVLGPGRMGLAEKAQAHIHQVWLEYGPTIADVRRVNLDVRQCLSDMGTELGIADARDVVAQCISQPGQDAPPDDSVGYLYPLALVVPGPQHIIDTATQRGLEALPWWPEWQRAAKTTCQWLRPGGHRMLLQQRVRDAGGQAQDTLAQVRSLEKSCDSFAHWRWKTLASVTRDLLAKKEALVVATASVSVASELGSRDGGAAATFLSSVSDAEFWRRTDVLAKLVAPMSTFSSWLRGCECHEEQRLAARAHRVQCAWQGCRAQRLASRTSQALADLDNLRRESHGVSDIVGAASSMLASLDMKMAWLQHEPYLIWQAGESWSMVQRKSTLTFVLDRHD